MIGEQQTKRRLAAIMFSDICGYSKLMGEDETAALEMVRLHNRLAEKAVAECDGRIIKRMGDGLLIEFPSAVLAVECAMLMQYSLHAYNTEPDSQYRFQIRIGVHLGDVVVSGDDIHGDGVNVASRIEPLAPPGGICISQDIYNMVHNKVELQFVSIGPKQLKNIARQIEIYRVLVAAADAKNMGTVSPLTTVLALGKKTRLRAWIAGAAALILAVAGFVLGSTWKRGQPRHTAQAVETLQPVGRQASRVVEPSSPGTIILQAADAVMHGNMKKTGLGITFWFDGFVSWTDQKIVPGKYKLFITYSLGASLDAGGPFTVSVGEKTFEGYAESTGAWERPKTFELGEVEISENMVTVKVSAATPRKRQLMAPRKRQLMALRNVQLSKID